MYTLDRARDDVFAFYEKHMPEYASRAVRAFNAHAGRSWDNLLSYAIGTNAARYSLSKRVIEFSMRPSHHCPHIDSDDCPARGMCLGVVDEYVLPYVYMRRMLQCAAWWCAPVSAFVDKVRELYDAGYDMWCLNISGDFAYEFDVNKLAYIMEGIPDDMRVFTYTATSDIDLSPLLAHKNFILNAANDKVWRKYGTHSVSRYMVLQDDELDKLGNNAYYCYDSVPCMVDCDICVRKPGGRVVIVTALKNRGGCNVCGI